MPSYITIRYALFTSRVVNNVARNHPCSVPWEYAGDMLTTTLTTLGVNTRYTVPIMGMHIYLALQILTAIPTKKNKQQPFGTIILQSNYSQQY